MPNVDTSCSLWYLESSRGRDVGLGGVADRFRDWMQAADVSGKSQPYGRAANRTLAKKFIEILLQWIIATLNREIKRTQRVFCTLSFT